MPSMTNHNHQRDQHENQSNHKKRKKKKKNHQEGRKFHGPKKSRNFKRSIKLSD